MHPRLSALIRKVDTSTAWVAASTLYLDTSPLMLQDCTHDSHVLPVKRRTWTAKGKLRKEEGQWWYALSVTKGELVFGSVAHTHVVVPSVEETAMGWHFGAADAVQPTEHKHPRLAVSISTGLLGSCT